VLEEGTFRPVGGKTEVTVNVRWIFATNKSLEDLLNHRHFRADLLSRIPFTVRVPALSERQEEILPLAAEFATRLGFTLAVEDEAKSAMLGYNWPGNVRDVLNLIQEKILVHKDPVANLVITLKDFTHFTNKWNVSGDGNKDGRSTQSIFPSGFHELKYRPATQAATMMFEKEYLNKKLSEFSGDVTKAAARCGMTVDSFRRRLQKSSKGKRMS
jgi:DNA-binding NtrC family response regulator